MKIRNQVCVTSISWDCSFASLEHGGIGGGGKTETLTIFFDFMFMSLGIGELGTEWWEAYSTLGAPIPYK